MLRLTLEPFVPDSMEVTEVGHHTSSIVTSIRALCRLHRHFLRIPELSFLPEPQGDGGDLSRQGHRGEIFLHSSGNRGVVIVTEWAWSGRRCRRRSLEDVLEDRVVVAIEPACERSPPLPTHLALVQLLVGTRSSHHGQPRVRPEIALGPKAKRRAHDRQDLSHADRTEEWNPAKNLPP